jgi:hypothetical protein
MRRNEEEGEAGIHGVWLASVLSKREGDASPSAEEVGTSCGEAKGGRAVEALTRLVVLWW